MLYSKIPKVLRVALVCIIQLISRGGYNRTSHMSPCEIDEVCFNNVDTQSYNKKTTNTEDYRSLAAVWLILAFVR